jgi:DNA-binding transcriptional regulator YbjK
MDSLLRMKFAAWASAEILENVWAKDADAEQKLAAILARANMGYMTLTADDKGLNELFDALIPEAQKAIQEMDLDALKEQPLIELSNQASH